MAEVSRFFDGIAYSANDMDENFYYAEAAISGVMPVDNELSMVTPTAYTYSLKSGIAFKTGYFYRNSTNLSLSSSAVTTGNKRIDRILLRLDNVTALEIVAIVLEGVETGGSPSAPSLTTATDIPLYQLLIDNTTGTPVYTLTDERVIISQSLGDSTIVTDNATYSTINGSKKVFVNSSATKTIDISGGAVSFGTTCYIHNLGAGTATVHAKTGGTGTGYDILLLQNEWVLLIWDTSEWIILNDKFTTGKKFAYTTPGAISHTVPIGRRLAKIISIGGGGGGGSRSSAGSGGGGGAGGAAIKILAVSPTASLSGTVGAKGTATGGGNNSGTAGSDSTFNTTIIGNGGGGGNTNGLAGAGGSASGGDINLPGQPGGNNVGTFGSGFGGNSILGSGGRPGATTSPTTATGAATGYGSGGGGGIWGDGTSGPGTNGTDGIILIEYGTSLSIV